MGKGEQPSTPFPIGDLKLEANAVVFFPWLCRLDDISFYVHNPRVRRQHSSFSPQPIAKVYFSGFDRHNSILPVIPDLPGRDALLFSSW
jgi:hypothetical protein